MEKNYFVNVEQFEITEIEDALIMQNKETKEVHILNQTAKFVFTGIKEQKTMRDIENEMLEMFKEISSEVIENDISEIVESFVQHGIISNA